ncbi:MAG: C4-dicarboxylate transporter DctA [Acidobacteriota bacterium]
MKGEKTSKSAPRPWYRPSLFVQVLIAIVLGVIVGHFFPKAGTALKPLGDGFVALIRMMIAPVIFCIVVHGISSMSDMKEFGRVGVKTLIYFEIVSTLALITGVIVGQIIRPGDGLHIDPTALDPSLVSRFVGSGAQAGDGGLGNFLLGIIPRTFVGALTGESVLSVLLIAVLTGFAISRLGDLGARVTTVIAAITKVIFGIVRIIVKAAPLGALGGIAFTVGNYGVASLANLAQLILTFYVTAIVFAVVILGAIAYMAGFSILRFIVFIKEELLIVLGTSSSETVLPDMMRKLERLGAPRSIVGLVFPTGYSFNTDGTNIYLTLSAIFLAQATDTHLTLSQTTGLVLFAMVASKGASGVTGTGFVTLAAILSAVPVIPVQALALLVGIDKFMSECRAVTNVVGNGVATIVVSRWERDLDHEKLRTCLAHPLAAGSADESVDAGTQ